MTSAIEPFTLAISDSEIDDLRSRLALTRWPERETVDDWSQGAPLDEVRALADHWRDGYDWRRCEARINALGLFSTEIDGLAIRFLHVRSKHDGARPLLLTHGWPGSIVEFLAVIEPLVDPEAHGGTADDAFHLVIPSLPGFGFSGKPERAGKGVEWIAPAWGELMRRLGYQRWFAQGGDWGAAVTGEIAAQAIAGCAGIHLNMVVARPPKSPDNLSPAAQQAIAAAKHYRDHGSGYSTQQRTCPQTIGYSLVDSPVGLLAWIFEKMHGWTDNNGSPYDALSRDTILDNVMLYWLPAAGASSARLYWESFAAFVPKRIDLPVAVTMFPNEIIRAPREWATHLRNIVSWRDAESGGHFAAWEEPEIFVREMRLAFALMD